MKYSSWLPSVFIDSLTHQVDWKTKQISLYKYQQPIEKKSPKQYKINLIKNLIHCALMICSETKIHSDRIY